MRMLLTVVALSAAAGFAQDVVQLAPERVKVLIENDQVRVLRFSEPGHSKLPMHSHPPYVSVAFTADYSKYMFPDGKTSEEHTKAGAVDFFKAVTHAFENLSDNTAESIMVELKDRPPAAAAVTTEMDPVKVDPKHYKVLIDNDRVRVLRARYGHTRNRDARTSGLGRRVHDGQPRQIHTTGRHVQDINTKAAT